MRFTARRVGVGLGVALLLGVGVPGAWAANQGETPWLGVYSQSLTPELREGFNYHGAGVLVNRVVPDSPADQAGLEKGDVITKVGLRTIDSPDELARVVRSARVGQSVAVEIMRDGKRQTLNARLAARSGDENEFNQRSRGDEDEDLPPDMGPGDEDHDFTFDLPEGMAGLNLGLLGRGRLGVRIQELNPDLGDYFGIKSGKGVLIVDVVKDTPAERAGLKAGDVITKVDDQAVSDPDDLVQALRSREGKISLTVMRHGASRTIAADIGDAPRVLRLRRGMGGNGHTMRWYGLDSSDRQSIERQLDELRDQLKDLRKEMQGLKR
jgi:serine protease Do